MASALRMQLRPLAPRDLRLIAPWLHAAGLGVPAGVCHKSWGERLASDQGIVCRFAAVAGRTVGFFRLDLAPDGTAEVTVLVAPTRRRRGLGGQLLVAAMAEARERGMRHLVAAVRTDNIAGRAFFGAAGFAEVPSAVPGFLRFRGAVAVPGRPPLQLAP